jgi:hypothetical protein
MYRALASLATTLAGVHTPGTNDVVRVSGCTITAHYHEQPAPCTSQICGARRPSVPAHVAAPVYILFRWRSRSRGLRGSRFISNDLGALQANPRHRPLRAHSWARRPTPAYDFCLRGRGALRPRRRGWANLFARILSCSCSSQSSAIHCALSSRGIVGVVTMIGAVRRGQGGGVDGGSATTPHTSRRALPNDVKSIIFRVISGRSLFWII